MQRLKHFLVALNGSASGYHALTEAIRLAQWSKGEVTAMTVTPPYQGDLNLTGVKDVQSLMVGFAGEILDKAYKTGSSLGMRINIRCEAGEPEIEIAAFYACGQFDAVVLGATRRSGIAGFLSGNTRLKIIRSLDETEVLMIPEQASVGWEKILLVMAETDQDAEIIERAAELARSYGGELTIQRLSNNFSARRKKTGAPDSGKADMILQRIRTENFQMVILSRKVGRRRSLIRVGLTDGIIAQNYPVLILRKL
ncbi:MAG: universal stress protein [Pseudomonadota bacterium]